MPRNRRSRFAVHRTSCCFATFSFLFLFGLKRGGRRRSGKQRSSMYVPDDLTQE
jgi:hypothetical protein